MSFVTKALGGLFGGGGSGGGGVGSIPTVRQTFAPTYTSYFDGRDVTIQPTDLVKNSLSRINDITAGTIGKLGDVAADVKPGFGRLTDATRTVFANARQRLADARLASTSDLRGNLEKRRVLGSSFATDSLARADAEFAKADQELTAQENQAQAQNFLAELDQTTQLINKQAEFDLNAVMASLNEMNLVSGVGQQVASSVQSTLTSNAQLQADLAVKNAAGAGGFISQLLFGKNFGGQTGISKLGDLAGSGFKFLSSLA